MYASDYTSLADVVRPAGGARRDKVALIFEDRNTTYADLDRAANGIAKELIRLGVGPGDRVAVLSKNNAAYVELLFGVAKAGAALVPLNWRLAQPEVEFILSDSEPVVLFVERGLEPLAAGAARSIRTVGFEQKGEIAYDGFEIAAGADVDPGVPVGRDDLAMIVYTSGTTGHPKGAMIANRNFERHCDLDSPATPAWAGVARDEVCLNVLPLFHVGGLEMILRPLFTGATVILHRLFDPDLMLTDIVRYGVTMTGLVPTALQMLLENPRAALTDFTTLDKFLYGAAPIPVPLLQDALDRMHCNFIQSYGMTEANGSCVMLAPEHHNDRDASCLRSAGKPMFGAQIRIVDANGRQLPTGQIGEISVRSNGVMLGYWRQAAATAETIEPDGWLHSGDAGFLDADGFVYVCDRVKDMICSGGENIYPTEVESAIFSHPAVAEVAVVGVPNRRWGETVHAVLTLKPGMSVDGDEIIRWSRERIAAYKSPRTVEVVNELPKNAAGKLLRRELRARAARQVSAA
jgi:acyl-CoA synthetase (AMP-forming)/AMP-acid ligase II